MKNLKTRVLKNCFQSIKKIQHAPDMLEVENAMRSAMSDAFKCRNRGIYIALSSDKKAERAKFDRREQLTASNSEEIKAILINYIPSRLHSTFMYKSLVK